MACRFNRGLVLRLPSTSPLSGTQSQSVSCCEMSSSGRVSQGVAAARAAVHKASPPIKRLLPGNYQEQGEVKQQEHGKNLSNSDRFSETLLSASCSVGTANPPTQAELTVGSRPPITPLQQRLRWQQWYCQLQQYGIRSGYLPMASVPPSLVGIAMQQSCFHPVHTGFNLATFLPGYRYGGSSLYQHQVRTPCHV